MNLVTTEQLKCMTKKERKQLTSYLEISEEHFNQLTKDDFELIERMPPPSEEDFVEFKEGPFKGYMKGEVDAVYSLLADAGHRIMHRRNGQFWVMFDDKPMTFGELDHLASTGFRVVDGEPGHLEFHTVPETNGGE
jgi:hypothetical protein